MAFSKLSLPGRGSTQVGVEAMVGPMADDDCYGGAEILFGSMAGAIVQNRGLLGLRNRSRELTERYCLSRRATAIAAEKGKIRGYKNSYPTEPKACDEIKH